MAWGANRMHFTYDAVGPMSVNFNGTEYFYLKNAQGDVTGLADSTGAKVVAYTYGPWGEAWGVSGTLASTLGAMNPLRYRGYVYDAETGFYYLNSRYYNPTWGRFINADGFVSTGQGISGDNMFAYCGNNPVNRYDPSGNAFLGIIAGAALLKLFIAGAASCLVYIGFKSIVNNPPASPPITIPKFEFKFGTTEKANEKADAKDAPVSPQYKKQEIFPADPYSFRPRGLTMKEYQGTYNGRIIEWRDPVSNAKIFEWNEDLQYGAHYHVMQIEWDRKHSGPHYLPGTPVPEPWNSIYFGG